MNISFWARLIHSVLIHQVYNPKVDEMTFVFGGKKVKFGCHEFCILTSLWYAGKEDIIGGSSKLVNKYRKKGS